MQLPSPRLLLKNLPYLTRHPRVGVKLAGNYWRRYIRGRQVLRGAELCVTYRCQLDCRHCLTKRLVDEGRRELTADEVVAVSRALADLGAIFVNLTGGEPLLREDIFEIVDRVARRRDLLVTLASNAIAFTPDAARRLRRAGCDMVTFSLDSASPKRHDESRRSSGSFDHLLEAIRTAKGESMEVWLTTILTDENAGNGDLEAMVDLSRRLGVTLTVNFTYAAGNWAGQDFRYTPETLEAFRRAIRRSHVRWEGSSNYGPEGCPAGNEKLYITPYGDVFPCAVLQGSFGSVRETPLSFIYKKITDIPYFDGRCKECLAVIDADFAGRFIHRLNLEPGGPFAADPVRDEERRKPPL